MTLNDFDEIRSLQNDMKKQKEDYSNSLRQLRDQINSVREQSRSESMPNNRAKGCYHCGIAGHAFNSCRAATEEEKKEIVKQLQQRTFNFEIFRKKVLQAANDRVKRSDSLNSKPATTKSTPSL